VVCVCSETIDCHPDPDDSNVGFQAALKDAEMDNFIIVTTIFYVTILAVTVISRNINWLNVSYFFLHYCCLCHFCGCLWGGGSDGVVVHIFLLLFCTRIQLLSMPKSHMGSRESKQLSTFSGTGGRH
jgi:hypothetical protein